MANIWQKFVIDNFSLIHVAGKISDIVDRRFEENFTSTNHTRPLYF